MNYKKDKGFVPCENKQCPSCLTCLRFLKYKNGAFWGGVFTCPISKDRCKHFVDKDAKDE